MKTLTLYDCKCIARKENQRSIDAKAWRVRTKKDAAFQALARRLNEGTGYIIATIEQLATQYPDLIRKSTLATTPFSFRHIVYMWCIKGTTSCRTGKVTFDFVPVASEKDY